MKNPLEKFYQMFSNDISIDLGTASTLMYVAGHGLALNEPSVVAINQKTGRVVAVGTDAKQMIGRTPAHVEALYPLEDGVISQFEAAEEMILYFLNRARAAGSKSLVRPRVLVTVPSGITNVERRAVRDAVRNAGAREAYLVEGPMAAAIGVHLPVYDPVGMMVIDIGGGTADIAVISLGGIVQSKNLHSAGNRLNKDITAYVRDEFKILLGDKTAEDIKLNIGSVFKQAEPLEAPIRGRDLVTGLPREVMITDADIREAIGNSVELFVDAVKEVLETTPPEVVSDVMNRGIVLVGGGALIRGLPELLRKELKIPIHLAEEPDTAVVRGAGMILENLDSYRDILVDDEESLPPQ